MYRIVGADGKEYGPVSVEDLRKWATEGRINAKTRVQEANSSEWKAMAEFAELAALLPARTPPRIPPLTAVATPGGPTGSHPRQGLAITSFVLGLISFLGCLVITGIPAIVCGHVARSRARRSPERYGGGGFATAGLVLGYLGVALTAGIALMLLPATSMPKPRTQSVSCTGNMKQIGLSFRVWALDHNDQLPFNVGTNQGGTMELCKPGKDGFDESGWVHFLVMSNELVTPKILICPLDRAKTTASRFADLKPENVSYRMHSGTNLTVYTPDMVLAVCPFHGTTLRCDGSVQENGQPAR